MQISRFSIAIYDLNFKVLWQKSFQEYQKAEAFLLRAEKPEIAVDLYREAGRIEDALRVAKEYAPSMVEEVQRIYVEQG